MPRIGVTFDDVAQAATKLLSIGESPSVLKIREILGTGSNSTIAEHLKVWRQQKSEQRTVALPEGIPKALLPPLETLWHIANEQADSRFAFYREQTDRKMEQLITERDTWYAQHRQTETIAADLQQQLSNALKITFSRKKTAKPGYKRLKQTNNHWHPNVAIWSNNSFKAKRITMPVRLRYGISTHRIKLNGKPHLMSLSLPSTKITRGRKQLKSGGYV
jgi:hypothetical protein